MTEPRFPKHDPAAADFWEARYRENFIPWDAGQVPQLLIAYASRVTAPHKSLVPGCGSAYEVRFMVEHGWDVLAIDFSPAAIAAAKKVLGPLANHVRQEDFFSSSLRPQEFDFVYERAFLCALPRRIWSDWAKRNAELITPGGRLGGFFYFDESERGPPFGLKAGELEGLLSPCFKVIETATSQDSIKLFQGKELWQVLERLPHDRVGKFRQPRIS
jgi:SAM-dependent methyltransferase